MMRSMRFRRIKLLWQLVRPGAQRQPTLIAE
jgi:hypothetical protein